MYDNQQLETLVTELVTMRIQFTITPYDEHIEVTAGLYINSLRNREVIKHPFFCSEDVEHTVRIIKGFEINEDDAIEYVWKFPYFEEEWPAEED